MWGMNLCLVNEKRKALQKYRCSVYHPPSPYDSLSHLRAPLIAFFGYGWMDAPSEPAGFQPWLLVSIG